MKEVSTRAEFAVKHMIGMDAHDVPFTGVCRNGPSHAEVKMCRGEPVLVEVGARCHGERVMVYVCVQQIVCTRVLEIIFATAPLKCFDPDSDRECSPFHTNRRGGGLDRNCGLCLRVQPSASHLGRLHKF